MPTTYTTTKTQAVSPPARAGIDLTSATATFTVTPPLFLGDVIKMVKVPKGATIVEIIVSCASLDSGAGLSLAVGDAGSSSRFLITSTIGQGGGLARINRLQGIGYTYPAESTIDVSVSNAAATGLAGSITLTAIYQMQQ